jgi:hypothetical protein
MNSNIMRKISQIIASASETLSSFVFKELDHIECTCLIIFYFLCDDLPDIFHVLFF